MDGYNGSLSSNTTTTTRLERAFLFTSPSEHEYAFSGKVTTYPGGGYVADLTVHADQATSLLQDLEANNWIDQDTKAVLVEFNVLNPNSKLFNQIILLFEYKSDGSTLWTTNVHAVQLYRYAGSAGVVALLSEIGCGIFVLVITILEVIKICRMRWRYLKEVWNVLQVVSYASEVLQGSVERVSGCVECVRGTSRKCGTCFKVCRMCLRYFKEVWNVLQWSALVLFYIAVVLYTLRSLWTVWVVEDLMNNPGNHTRFLQIVQQRAKRCPLGSLLGISSSHFFGPCPYLRN